MPIEEPQASQSAAPSALHEKNFLRFFIGAFIAMLGRQMLTVAVGWEMYEKTGSAMALGYIGLAQFLPVLLLTLPAGHIVDQFDRKKVLLLAQVAFLMATGGLFLNSILNGPPMVMYVCLALAGLGRAFHSPANAALIPQVVSEKNFTNAVTWGSINYQASSILGPAFGGLILGLLHRAAPVYLVEFCTCLIFVMILFMTRHRPHKPSGSSMTLQSMLSGVEFVRRTPIILAAITLDMFAVLFGGAMALLPVYAKDILHVGPSGLGWMQAAPSVGAIIMGFFLARRPEFRKAGPVLLCAVIGFGVATIVFGLSKNFWLSMGMLLLLGMFDNVSVVIRQALVQLRTPDEMRGRVSAINYVFIGTSNELGGFESGLVANWMGPVFSVVFGGFATIATVLGVAALWPELRNLDHLHEKPPEKAKAEPEPAPLKP
jgi:MFS family permease